MNNQSTPTQSTTLAAPGAIAPALRVRSHSLASPDCTVKDDRTPEQKLTHRWAIVAKDRGMSGWGGGTGGVSRCAWACHPDVNSDRVWNWVNSRKDMSRSNLVDLNTYRAPKGTSHFHVYVCGPDHVGARY